MSLALLLSLQAAAAPVPPASSSDMRGVDFDLAKVGRARPSVDVHSLFVCAPNTGSEIVVCARRAGPVYPLEEMARIFEPKPLKAETRIGDATGSVRVEQGTFGNDTPSAHSGLTSNRIMVGIKLPF